MAEIFDIGKAHENGIEALLMGGEFDGENFFREKDVMVSDYSEPLLHGKCLVVSKKVLPSCLAGDLFCIDLQTEDGCKGRLLLTKDEYEAGLINSAL